MSVQIGAMQKNTNTTHESGFAYNASRRFPFSNAEIALVPPQPGQGKCVNALKGQTILIGTLSWINTQNNPPVIAIRDMKKGLKKLSRINKLFEIILLCPLSCINNTYEKKNYHYESRYSH